MNFQDTDIFQLEESVWLSVKPVGVGAYDFSFEPLFSCRRPYEMPEKSEIICRLGAFSDYEDTFNKFLQVGFSLVNSVEQHFRASELPLWYPLIEEFTPRSIWFDKIPKIQDIEANFSYPVFIKGARQTAKHQASLSIARDRTELIAILEEYQRNPILHWQQLVCREFIELRKIDTVSTQKVSPSFEFRSFWYKGNLVGVGHYWSEFVNYDWTKEQEVGALKLASEVCTRIDVPFLVIDLALTNDGKWIVIECNDAQESGYVGVEPIAMWKNIIELENSLVQQP